MCNSFLIDSYEPLCHTKICDYLYSQLTTKIISNTPIVFICIGTDRSTGDSLGPLVGYKLKDLSLQSCIHVYGSLEHPIHAKNISIILDKIKSTFNNPFIIAIDSCLGKACNIGKIIIKNSPVLPGAALNKNLPPVGDMSIMGVVNISGTFDFITLQNTRLSIVMNLADAISNSIISLNINFNKKLKNNK